MKKIVFILTMLFSSASYSQWIVNDPMNYIPNISSYLKQVEIYTQKLKDYKEFIDQTQFLKDLIGDDGLWEETFKALANIRSFLKEARDVISAVQARDVYALIEHLPVDDTWKDNIHNVLNQAHGLVPDEVYFQLVEQVAQRNPILSDFLIQARQRGRVGLEHRLNAYYFASARKQTYEQRMEMLNKQKAAIQSFRDRSQGESMNMMNSQLLLISQQNEELLKAQIHQIMNSQTEYMEKLRRDDQNYQLYLDHENERVSININDFLPEQQ